MADAGLSSNRREILGLRARVVVLERCALAALELALRVRPEELSSNLELARNRLSLKYEAGEVATDVDNPAERIFLAKEVERLMRGMQADMGFEGGVSIPESG